MMARAGAQVPEERRPAVQRLEHEEAGQRLGAGLDLGDRALGEFVGAGRRAAADVLDDPGERRMRLQRQRRGDMRAVEHDELVAPFQDAREAEQDAPVGLFGGDAEAQIGLRRLDRLRRCARRRNCRSPRARRPRSAPRRWAWRRARIPAPRLARRQRQMNDGAARVGRNVDGRRQFGVGGGR